MNKLLQGIYLFLAALPKLVTWIKSLENHLKKEDMKNALENKDIDRVNKLFNDDKLPDEPPKT